MGTGWLIKWMAQVRHGETLHWPLWREFLFFHVAIFSSLLPVGCSGSSHHILYWIVMMSLYYLKFFLPSACLLYHSIKQAVSHWITDAFFCLLPFASADPSLEWYLFSRVIPVQHCDLTHHHLPQETFIGIFGSTKNISLCSHSTLAYLWHCT